VYGDKGDKEEVLCLGESKNSNASVSSKGPRKFCNHEVKSKATKPKSKRNLMPSLIDLKRVDRLSEKDRNVMTCHLTIFLTCF